MSKKEYGITLVALVVTIVILLILAGVVLNLILGENGLITKARDTKSVWNNAVASDISALADIEEIIRSEVSEDYNYEGPNAVKVSDLNEGDWIKYYDPQGNEIDVIILYNNEQYGVQAIAAYPVEDIEMQSKLDSRISLEHSNINTTRKLASDLQEGDHLWYVLNDGKKIECIVLYQYDPNDEIYNSANGYNCNPGKNGPQVVTFNCVDTVTLGYNDEGAREALGEGKTDFEYAQWSYNNALKTLNSKSKEWALRNPSNMMTSIRCIGSDPINPENIIENRKVYFENDEWSFEKSSTHYSPDGNQLVNTNSTSSGPPYDRFRFLVCKPYHFFLFNYSSRYPI